jgi:hypothetical protein
MTDIAQCGRNVRKVPILLQKSAATTWAVGPFVESFGFDALALTLFTQLRRYAMHGT